MQTQTQTQTQTPPDPETRKPQSGLPGFPFSRSGGPGWNLLKIAGGPSGIFAEIRKFYEGIYPHTLIDWYTNLFCRGRFVRQIFRNFFKQFFQFLAPVRSTPLKIEKNAKSYGRNFARNSIMFFCQISADGKMACQSIEKCGYLRNKNNFQ